MELFQLRYFLETARERNFTRAAGHLNIAQAALSEQIRKLEEELGVSLFNRGRRQSTLTACGEALRRHAEIVLIKAQEAKEAVMDIGALRTGQVEIGTIPSVSSSLLPVAITRFRQAYPGIDIRLVEATSELVAKSVAEGAIELGIIQLPTGEGLFMETILLKESFILVVNVRHRLAGRKNIRLETLAQESFIAYRGRALDSAREACRAAGFSPRVVCETGELTTVHTLVGAGLGVAILPRLAFRSEYSGCRAVAIHNPKIERQIGLIHHARRQWSPAAAQFAKILRACEV